MKYLIGVCLVAVWLGIVIATVASEETCQSIDSVQTVAKDTAVVVEVYTPSPPKFKKSDIVCAYGKYSGPVCEIIVPLNDNEVYVYTVCVTDAFAATPTWEKVDYYDTELERGKCP